MTSFISRRIGPRADVYELEYVAALHQTCPETTRSSAMISSIDIQRYLKSRHALDITHAQARDIVRGLGGGVLSLKKARIQQLQGTNETTDTTAAKEIIIFEHNDKEDRLTSSIKSNKSRIGEHPLGKYKPNAKRISNNSHMFSNSLRRKRNLRGSDISDLNKWMEELNNPKILYLDLVQMTSIILIPTIARFVQEWKEQQQHQKEQEPSFHPIPTTDENKTEDETKLPPQQSSSIILGIGSFLPKSSLSVEVCLNNDENPTRRRSISPTSTSGATREGTIIIDVDNANHHHHHHHHHHKEERDHPSDNCYRGSHDEVNDNGKNTNDDDDSLSPKPKGLLELVHSAMLNMIQEKNDNNKNKNNNDDSDDDKDDDDNHDNNNDYSSSSSSSPSPHDLDGPTMLPPLMTTDLVKTLLIKCGEMERANDPKLLQRMVDVAYSPTGRFDATAFCNALTCDLQDWKVGCEDDITTYVYDIFGFDTMESFDRIVKEQQRVSKRQRKSSLTSVKVDNSEIVARQDGTMLHSSCTALHPSPPKMSGAGLSWSQAIDKETAAAIPTVANKSMEGLEQTKAVGVDHNGSVAREKEGISLQFSSGPVDPSFKVSILTSRSSIPEEEMMEGRIELHPRHMFTIIDNVVDSYGSVITLLLAWLTYIFSTASYGSLVISTDPAPAACENDNSFGCTLLRTIISWLIIAIFTTLFGLVVLIPLSLGNHPTMRSPLRMLFSSIIAIINTLVPSVAVDLYLKWKLEEPYTSAEQVATDRFYSGTRYFGTALGFCLGSIYFANFLVGVWKKMNRCMQTGWLVDLFSQTSERIGTARLKRAGTRKVNKLLSNASDMHLGTSQEFERSLALSSSSLRKSQTDNVFQNYTLYGERMEECGSLLWTIDQLRSGKLFETEGVWLPARLWIFQFAQVILCLIISFSVFRFVRYVEKQAAEGSKSLPEGLPQWVYDIVPTGKEVKIAMYPAACVSIVVAALLTLAYIPSTVNTILKYRCGLLPSLHSRGFNVARKGPDTAYMNTANALYGMLGAAVLFFILIGLVLFLFIWDFSRGFMLRLLAWGIGLTITICLKTIMVTFCRKSFFRGFYRIAPGRANVSTLALECWFIGLGGGVLISRITQFLLAAAFWIGRIDEPFLADNVCVMGFQFDYVPVNYIKDILVHEAHRHPYIERLGAMYLMRLRHEGFGRDAGGCWRQLFVLSLMPWLMKYRVFHDHRCSESLKDQALEQKVKLDEDEDLAKITSDLVGGGLGMVEAVGDAALSAANAGLVAVGEGLESVGSGVNDVATAGQNVADIMKDVFSC